MKLIKLIEKSYIEAIGKHYLFKAFEFALSKSFGKSYEFLLTSLDILTCDCEMTTWIEKHPEIEKKIFNDLKQSNNYEFEYLFCKAYFLSFYETNQSLYIGLDAIDKYITEKKNEYGYYVRGKILNNLKRYEEALTCFLEAQNFRNSPRILYRIGRTKEELLEQNGIRELFESFEQNTTSSCCLRILRSNMFKRGFSLNLPEDESNEILQSFNSDDSWLLFWMNYDQLLEAQVNEEQNSSKSPLPSKIIQDFTNVLISQKNNFLESDNPEIEPETESYNDYGSSYEEFGGYNGYSDDVINDAFEGDPSLTWNID